jgi:hypothetical protein
MNGREIATCIADRHPPTTTAPATIFDDGKKEFWAAWSAIVT